MLKQVMLSAALLLSVFAPAQADESFKCTIWECEIKWKTKMGDIDYASVCHNFQDTPRYAACRKAAVKAFEDRCEHGKKQGIPAASVPGCQAVQEYKP